ncbi:ABC transporter ATP-binding protein [Glaciecola sp. SC05]|uniref:ABC transporter ATP-binding protein n=1 Tax=Glaciecola sp. SC05 TaxID=1987355 RepID=UPI003529C65B
MLNISAVNKTYLSGDTSLQVLKDVSLELQSGNSLSIQGPSGCGKSTLLHLLGALDNPDSGQIVYTPNQQTTINIHDLSEIQADEYRRKHIGFVFQKFNLIDCLSVYDNILLPSRLNQSEHQDYIALLIDTMQIAPHLKKLPNQLSGGEQQRVAIARALAHQPSMVLADEPTGNLDEDNSHIVSQLLFDTCTELKTTLIIVTHSAQVAQQATVQMKMHNKRLSV